VSKLKSQINCPAKSQLEEMANVDMRTVDPDTFVDIKTVTIRTDLPKEEQILDYIQISTASSTKGW
jgi:hypothetical protein